MSGDVHMHKYTNIVSIMVDSISADVFIAGNQTVYVSTTSLVETDQ